MSSSGIIQPLSTTAINQIAAGEVIDRPMSIVKELIDNSIDAGTSKITIDLIAGGVQKIRVHDNGCGIFYPDLLHLAKNHYTSKLTDLTDLYNNPKLGFRGEALASIAHVSSVTAASKASEASIAYAAVYENPEAPTVSPTHHETGTTITANYLFDQLPVRRRFLKSESTEYQYCHNLVVHYALLFPDIDFIVSHNGKCTLNTTQATTALAVAQALFNHDTQLQPLDAQYGSIRIQGFASTPQLHAGSRNRQYLAVNQRPIKSMIINRALSDAYKEHIVPNRHPYCLLALTVPDEHVDVNIHPQKQAVKFLDEAAVYRAVKHSLSTLFSKEHFQQPATLTEAPRSLTKAPTQALAEAPRSAPSLDAQHVPAAPASPDAHPEPSFAQPLSDSRIHTPDQPAPLPTEPPSPPGEQLGFPPPKPQHPHYLQVFGTYIILQVDQSVWILDQHAVHERILYERIRANHTAESQPYLSPKVMTLDTDQMQRYTDHQDTVRQLGFDIDVFGPEQIIIRGVPSLFMDTNSTAILSDLLNQLEPNADSTTIHSWQQRACKSAIKAGKRLLPADVDALIAEFLEAPNNFTCPHGRPLFVQYHVADFEQWFKRR